MSNPYDPTQGPGQSSSNPYGTSPYGSSSGDSSSGSSGAGGPYGGGSYGGTPGGGYGGAPAGGPYGGGPGTPYGGGPQPTTDGISIAGFVLSILFCIPLVGLILSIVGLSRTKGGRRKGRWAAITGTILGVLGTLLLIGGGVAVVFFAKHVVTPENATAGECVNVSSDSTDNTYSLFKKSCTDAHDAEVVYVGKISDSSALQEKTFNAQAVCSGLMPSSDVSKIGSSYDWAVLTRNPDSAKSSDKFLCYVEPTSGAKLDHALLG